MTQSENVTIQITDEAIQIANDPNLTKSSKIRTLYSMNYSRSQISKLLNIRYQHVRNVLITPIKKI
jgi:hypothetical protein